MRIDEFVGYFRMAKDKKAECDKRITKKYIPFITKITNCERVVKATTVLKKNQDDIGVYHQNTPARYLIFNMTLLQLYTDIEINDDTLYDNYDKLNEIGALDVLLSCIPEHEFKEFSTLLSMTMDDFLANERDLTAYLDRKMEDLAKLAEQEVVNNG